MRMALPAAEKGMSRVAGTVKYADLSLKDREKYLNLRRNFVTEGKVPGKQ